MAKGFQGFPGNVQDLMKQAQSMQEKLAKAQGEVENITAEGTAGGGMVKVVVNGRYEVLSVKVEKEVVNPNDIDMLQDLILAASNDALKKVKEDAKQALTKVTGGLSIPGLFQPYVVLSTCNATIDKRVVSTSFSRREVGYPSRIPYYQQRPKTWRKSCKCHR